MSESKWTPGPWVVQTCAVSSVLYLAAGAWPFGSTICELEDEPREGTREANARLIAAAPELYAGLVELLDETEAGLIASASSRSGRDDDDFREEFPDDYERCKRLRAVLAKARGEP